MTWERQHDKRAGHVIGKMQRRPTTAYAIATL
jgi:hypothetical protein